MNESEQLRKSLDLLIGKTHITESKMLLEYDENLSDADLRNEIVTLLKTEDDREMLDKIYTALNQGGLDDRIAKVLASDEDTKGKIDIFAGIIFHTPGTFAEKQQFLEDFPDGFIDISKLTTKNNIQSMDSWLTGSPFVERVFNELYKYSEMGIGKGEYALAVLSPDIKFAGRSATDHGDVNIGGTSVEVKAQVTAAGGRFMDARKAKMVQTGIFKAFKDAGLNHEEVSGKSGISDSMWVKTVRPMIEEESDRKNIAKEIINGLFTYVSSSDSKGLVNALTNGDLAQIRHEWGILSYTNYQKMSSFSAMLMLSLQDNSSLYFTDANDISTKIKAKGAFILGAEQTIHPQVVIDMKAVGDDFDAGDEGGDEAPDPKQGKAKRKSKDEIKSDNRAKDLAQKRADFKSNSSSRSPQDKALYGRDKADNWFNDRFK